LKDRETIEELGTKFRGIVPEEVTVGSELLFQLLQPLAESLRFELKQPQTLSNLHPVKEFLLQTIYE